MPFEGLRALDVGCGGGLLSESLARLGADVTGIDPSQPLVDMARTHAQRHPATSTIDYRGGTSVEALAESQTKEYDMICILEVLEHATDIDSLLGAATSLLKDDGTLFISTVNKTLKSHLFAILGAEYIMGYLPVGTHDWNQFLAPRDVEERIRIHGMQSIDVQGMIATKPPPLGNWDWKLDTRDTDVNWIGAYRFAKK